MDKAWSALSKLCFVTLSISSLILAYCAIQRTGISPIKVQNSTIDYNYFVTILLTTVTVVFSVAAIALGVIGAIGFNNLKNEAAKYAQEEAIKEIKKSFAKNGAALTYIDTEFQRDDGHLRQWMIERVRKEVVILMPLVAARLESPRPSDNFSGPTDEGETE